MLWLGIFTSQDVDRLDRFMTPMLNNDQLTTEAHVVDLCVCAWSVDVHAEE